MDLSIRIMSDSDQYADRASVAGPPVHGEVILLDRVAFSGASMGASGT